MPTGAGPLNAATVGQIAAEPSAATKAYQRSRGQLRCTVTSPASTSRTDAQVSRVTQDGWRWPAASAVLTAGAPADKATSRAPAPTACGTAERSWRRLNPAAAGA